MVDRFDGPPLMQPYKNGDFVRYSDYAELEAENERLKRLNKGLHDEVQFMRKAAKENRDRYEALSRTGAVKVKALEWWTASAGDIIADSLVGRYRLGKVTANENYRLETPSGLVENTAPDFYWPEHDAKATAQADYERRTLSALEPAAPEGQQEAVAWATVRVEDTCDGLLIHPDDAKKWGLVADHPYEGTFLPDGRYRIALTRLAEQAVTEAMKSALKALRPFYNAVYNDNGDISVSGPYNYDEAVAGYYAYRRVEAALKATMETGR